MKSNIKPRSTAPLQKKKEPPSLLALIIDFNWECLKSTITDYR